MDASRLEAVPIFSDLPRKERKAVAQHADEVQVPEGSRFVEEGRLAYELFVIESGTAEVLDGDKVIAQVGPGDVIGEIGVLKSHKRTASVVATSPIQAIVMYGPELTALKNKMPHVMAELNRLVEERSGDS